MTSILDDLERLEKEATPGPWPCYADSDIADQITIEGLLRPALPPSDCALIAAMRNHIKALINVARAAEKYLEDCDLLDTKDLREALKELDK